MKKLIACGILVCLTVYTAVLYNSVAILFFAEIELLLPLLLFLALVGQKLCVTAKLPQSRYFFSQEETKGLNIEVQNKSIAPIGRCSIKVSFTNLTTGENRQQWLRQPLARGTNQIALPEWELGYGVWKISLKRMRIYDWWKFWSLPGKKPKPIEFIQLPRQYDIRAGGGISEHDPMWESTEYHPYKSGSDSSYTREIREYRPGDRLSNIHWKLSAKRDELLVKEYGLPLGCGLLVGISLEGLTTEMLELLYSLLWGFRKISVNLLLTWCIPEEAEPFQLAILKDEDVYQAMEVLMRRKLTGWGEKPRPDLPARQLWLEPPLRLLLDGEPVEDFSEGTLQERLLDMELIL